MTYTVIIPTLNLAADWERFTRPILASTPPERVLIVDSASTDGTVELARKAGMRVEPIERAEFNHGATRQLAANLCPDSDVLIYLTQDAILANEHSIPNLLKAFEDPQVAAAYGRQFAHAGAGPIEVHARIFNYPAQSRINSFDRRKEIGCKTIFLSNNFGAYRRDVLQAMGGFPTNVLIGEDTIVAARMLLAGWKTAYVADAEVYHSHSYTLAVEFQRAFDTGYLHADEPWLLTDFGSADGEGLRFVKSEMAYLLRHRWPLVFTAAARTAVKLVGYRIGRMGLKFSRKINRRLSRHPNYWVTAR